jgi:hypothetical protein
MDSDGMPLVHIISNATTYGFVNTNVTYTQISFLNINFTYNNYYVYRSGLNYGEVNVTNCCFFRGVSGIYGVFIFIIYR